MPSTYSFLTSIRIGGRFVARTTECAASPEEAAQLRIGGLVSIRYEPAVFDWERKIVPATKEIVLS